MAALVERHTMAAIRDTLIDYLRDAYAMEQQAISMIDRQLERLESYPDFTARLRQHRDETEHQVERLETALHRLGTDSSALKTMGAKLSANMQAMMNIFASDEVIKDLLASYTLEQWEIVNYKVLIQTAQAAGEVEIQRLAEESLREEEAMASWIDSQIPIITRSFLSRFEAGGQQAAR